MLQSSLPRPQRLPKGAYPRPTGGWAVDRKRPTRQRDVRVYAVLREPVDTRKFVRAVLALAREMEKNQDSDKGA
jgi:hypothetical protein